MRMLIAEDDFTSRTLLAAVLKKNGHEVMVTVNGAEAWDAMQHPDAPKLAIIDWMMPEMDGLGVVRLVRTLQTDQPPYIIMLTSKGGKADIIAGLDVGANDYLTKPFDLGELHARVNVGCRMVEMQAALLESREALVYQATHDPLTGLLNRRAILDHLHKELARASRNGDGLCIGICDIDHFKRINDTYGHQTGDDALCSISNILSGYLRNYDSIGRMGGEEFLVITPVKAKNNCASIFKRLCSSVAESKIATRSGDLSITLSIGVACTAVGRTVDEMLGAADTALYQAKEMGRNSVCFEYTQFIEKEGTCAS